MFVYIFLIELQEVDTLLDKPVIVSSAVAELKIKQDLF